MFGFEFGRRTMAWAIAATGIVLFFASESYLHEHEFWARLASELGTALIILGGIGVLLETQHWQHYYTAKLTDALNSQEWQDDLLAKFKEAAIFDPMNYPKDKAALIALHAARVQLGLALEDTNMSRELASLIEEEAKVLHGFANGYKSGMKIVVRYNVAEPGFFDVVDTTEYVISGGPSNKLNRLVYAADEGEIVAAKAVKFDRFDDRRNERISLFTESDGKLIEASLKSCFVTRLEKTVDLPVGTRVIVEAHYRVRQNSLFFWQSEEAVHGYQMTIRPPDGFGHRVVPFMRKTTPSEVTDFQNESWSLPFHGVGWILFPKSQPVSANEIEITR